MSGGIREHANPNPVISTLALMPAIAPVPWFPAIPASPFYPLGAPIRSSEQQANLAQPNQIWFYPFTLGVQRTLLELAIRVRVAGAAGAQFRIGIYTSSSDHNGPLNLLVDTGPLAGDVAPVTLDVPGLSAIMPAGLYWTAFLATSAAIGLSGALVTALPTWQPGVIINGANISTAFVALNQSAFPFGALPPIASPNNGATGNGSANPVVYGRFGA